MNKRLQKLSAFMESRRIDALILSTTRDAKYCEEIFYYTGFAGYGEFIFSKNAKKPLLLVSAIEHEKASKTAAKPILITRENRKIAIAKALEKSKTIGIDKQTMTVAQLEEIKKALRHSQLSNKNLRIKFIDVGRELLKLRSAKEKYEIENIQKACRAGDIIFSEIIENFRFKTEKEIENFILKRTLEMGLEASFPPIVASGNYASDIHHLPSGKLQKGFLILDFGCKSEGYCSDMTRTIYLGEPSVKEKEIYNHVLGIQMECVKRAKSGAKCREIHQYALDSLGSMFVHGLGHGVGLRIHEAPNLNAISKDVLGESMVVTIEPGIYSRGKYGIRIEDTVLIKKISSEPLTKSAKDLISIQYRG